MRGKWRWIRFENLYIFIFYTAQTSYSRVLRIMNYDIYNIQNDITESYYEDTENASLSD